MYLIYDKETSRILSKESKHWQQAAYKTMSAAQAALTRMQKKYALRKAADAARGPLSVSYTHLTLPTILLV